MNKQTNKLINHENDNNQQKMRRNKTDERSRAFFSIYVPIC